jgi:tRNA-modifying protein YgfZ
MDEPTGYRAATESTAVFERTGLGMIAVAGSDRLTYLHAMLTADIAPLKPGSGCYSAYLTPQGRMIADMRVLELGDLALLDLDRGSAQTVLQKLDEFVFSEDVKLGNLTEVFAGLIVAGPAAAGIVARTLADDGGSSLGEADLAAWPEFQNRRTTFRGEMVLVAASKETGGPGFGLYIERPHLSSLMESILRAGAAAGTPEAAETLRIEAGRPLFGADMDTETIPLEAGIEDRAISFTKGCYPGQEVIIRVVRRGHGRIARRLAGVLIGGTTVPDRGDRVRVGEREAGRVTSAAWSPRLGAPAALAMLQRDFLEVGTALEIQHEGMALPARVVTLPFQVS